MDQQTILEQIQQGGKKREQAVSTLYSHYSPNLYGYFIRFGIPNEDVKEMVQDVFIQVIKNAHTFRGESKISTWLWAVARNQCLMYIRKKKLPFDEYTDQASDGSGTSSEERLIRKTLRECVEFGFKEFAIAEPDRAEILRLVAWYDWSMKDIASYLDKKLGATREYLSQCRKKLKPFLAHCLEHLPG